MNKINFELLRAAARPFQYFQRFPRLLTLSAIGVRQDVNATVLSCGIERGIALHVHLTRKWLVAHQWAYNGSNIQAGAVCRDRLVAYSVGWWGWWSRFRTYNAAKDQLGTGAGEEELVLFRHCLGQFEREPGRKPADLFQELRKLPLPALSNLPHISKLDCGSWPDPQRVGGAVQFRELDFNSDPLRAIFIEVNRSYPIYIP